MDSNRKPHAMILAAGLGTRLQPLTLDLAKPLVPIGDASMLEHIARQLKRAGHVSAAINTHYMREEFSRVFRRLPLEVKESFEPEILGTAGGVAALRDQLGSPVVVYNGDIYCRPPLEQLTSQVQNGGICLAIVPRDVGHGTVGIHDGRVVRLRGEVFDQETSGGDYIGVLALSEEALWELPTRGCLIGDYCLPRLRQGKPVHALCGGGKWSDIGTLDDYIKSNFEWLKEHSETPEGSFLGDDCDIAKDVELSGSIVGQGATVSGHGRLERCIVWPFATAVAPLSDAIVTQTGRIVSFARTGAPRR